MKKTTVYFGLLILLISCYGVDEQTSEIGSTAVYCLSEKDWTEIISQHSPDKIKDSMFIEGLAMVNNHFLKPEYVLYFDEEPREIIGCDHYFIRVAFNPDICAHTLDGLSAKLSDKEQVRMRNRVLAALLPYECEEGKKSIQNEMAKPAVPDKEHSEH